jgi:hypothetical protein
MMIVVNRNIALTPAPLPQAGEGRLVRGMVADHSPEGSK